MPPTETSLMMNASSVASQSELGDFKSEYWLKKLNRSSPLAVSCDGSVLTIWVSYVEVKVYMTSFTVISCDLETSDEVFNFFATYISVCFNKKVFYHIDG